MARHLRPSVNDEGCEGKSNLRFTTRNGFQNRLGTVVGSTVQSGDTKASQRQFLRSLAHLAVERSHSATRRAIPYVGAAP